MTKAERLLAVIQANEAVKVKDYTTWETACKKKGADKFEKEKRHNGEVIAIKGRDMIGIWTDNYGGLVY